jgi:hypothetical protein
MLGGGNAAAQTAASTEDIEVMTRGPVHEAFAEAVVFDPKPGIIVPKQPPALIEEIQPDQRPTGDNVAWIPGYWAWDEEQNDFLWVSGVWRNLPPGREWVPGYWSQVETGHQWTSGYWQDAETDEVTYLPEPPRSVETGPNVPATSDDQTWIPGTWQYQDDHYAWRAGYWVTARPDWCWTPSYYRWTPSGYVYVDGYWDYPVVNRGVIFAPVRFRSAYYARPYYYSPFAIIGVSVFWNHLFIRPSYCHYYFGDYYDWGYRDRYYASYAYGYRYRGGYDPIFAYSRWQHRHDRDWYRGRENYFEYRRDHAEARPPRTWSDLNRLPEADRVREDFGFAERYDRVVGSRDGSTRRFQAVTATEREQISKQRSDIRNFARERQQREVTANRTRADGNGRAQVSSVKASRSPVVARREDRTDRNGGPPARLERKVSERRVTAANTTSARQAESRGGSTIAKNEVRPSRETRTVPGQRREGVSAAERTSRSSTDSITRRETSTIPSADRTRANSQTDGNRAQVAPSQTARREASGSRSGVAPQTDRRIERPPVRTDSTRKVAPSGRSTISPAIRQPNADQIRKSNPRVTPQPRVQQRPVPQVQPRREQTYRPQPRVTQPAPQRQRTQLAPPRQAIQPRQAMPQRQTARPQVSAPRQQSSRGSSSGSHRQSSSSRSERNSR